MESDVRVIQSLARALRNGDESARNPLLDLFMEHNMPGFARHFQHPLDHFQTNCNTINDVIEAEDMEHLMKLEVSWDWTYSR